MPRQKNGSEEIINLKKEENKKFLSRFKLSDSYTSLILGIIFVFIAGILFFVFLRGDRTQDTSSTQTTEIEETQEDSQTLSTYTVKAGDDLWNIAEDVYSDGYKWTEIARENKLTNPGLIHVGVKLTLPDLPKKEVAARPETSPTPTKAPEKPVAGRNVYTVKTGDSLWKISENTYKNGYKWVEIAKTNKLTNPNIIHAGNKLSLPSLPVAAVVSNAITGKSYKVVEGDNLWEISVRAYADGYKWPELAKANKLNNPHLIYPDQVIQLPR